MLEGILIGVGSVFALLGLFAFVAARRFRRRAGFRRFFRRLETTPEQEAALEGIFSDLRESVRALRFDPRGLRQEVAVILRESAFDEASANGTLERRREGVVELQARLVEAMKKVHQTLDPAQRERLAVWLERRCGGRHARAHG